MSLQFELDQISNELVKGTPLEAMQAMEQSIKEVQEEGLVTGLTEGVKAKDFTLVNHLGETIHLYEELEKGPVILTFYRGSWCPYCNRQLKAYQEIMPDIQELGAQLFAISPQTPDHSLSLTEKHDLAFQVLSDTRGIVSAKYNILFEVPDYLKHAYKTMGLDLEGYNGKDNSILPVPATFMIDETGEIRFSHVNPNYMTRLEPSELLRALRKL
ncbi:AhpC/TSA family protein [Cytobacillus spongiae]|jgi:peroxiredoxin|uniref:peroxiredoxin-like family protein n=1 Tax=Cytobacillus spongiae TaxID=2901381 RepID=UPI001F3CB4A4|nr:redoxin domain-containing protein [Cytobacillus spongiae]UII55504.1 AhpC/TSA family protein [Cytobacillus spongiae]